MIKVGICDDSAVDRERISEAIRKYVEEMQEEILLVEYNSAEDFLQKQDIDILFLDIEMEKMSGIELKNILQKSQRDIKIIFTTSHQEMMEEAFGKQVYGFLQKPIEEEKLWDKLDIVLEDIKEEPVILFTEKGKECHIYAEELMYIVADGKYSDVVLKNQERHFSDKSIGEWSRELDNKSFFLCHRSYLVNLYYVKKIEDGVILLNGEMIPVSRRLKKELKEAYREYVKQMAR